MPAYYAFKGHPKLHLYRIDKKERLQKRRFIRLDRIIHTHIHLYQRDTYTKASKAPLMINSISCSVPCHVIFLTKRQAKLQNIIKSIDDANVQHNSLYAIT